MTARLAIVPMELADANAFVSEHHRHHQRVVGHKFSIGVADDAGQLRGVAIIGRPVARGNRDRPTLHHAKGGSMSHWCAKHVTRTATNVQCPKCLAEGAKPWERETGRLSITNEPAPKCGFHWSHGRTRRSCTLPAGHEGEHAYVSDPFPRAVEPVEDPRTELETIEQFGIVCGPTSRTDREPTEIHGEALDWADEIRRWNQGSPSCGGHHIVRRSVIRRESFGPWEPITGDQP